MKLRIARIFLAVLHFISSVPGWLVMSNILLVVTNEPESLHDAAREAL